MDPVVCKFRLVGIRTHMGGRYVVDEKDEKAQKWVEARVVDLEFLPVYANNNPKHPNWPFWSATPSGKIELSVVNEEAVKQFELQREYYVTFTEERLGI